MGNWEETCWSPPYTENMRFLLPLISAWSRENRRSHKEHSTAKNTTKVARIRRDESVLSSTSETETPGVHYLEHVIALLSINMLPSLRSATRQGSHLAISTTRAEAKLDGDHPTQNAPATATKVWRREAGRTMANAMAYVPWCWKSCLEADYY